MSWVLQDLLTPMCFSRSVLVTQTTRVYPLETTLCSALSPGMQGSKPCTVRLPKVCFLLHCFEEGKTGEIQGNATEKRHCGLSGQHRAVCAQL